MRLSITTPTGALVDTEADEVTAPGALGEFGVLPGHIPFLSALKAGVLIYRIKDQNHVLAVGLGFLEVARSETGDKVIVLVDRAVTGAEVNRDAVAKEIVATESDLSNWKEETGGEYQALVQRRDWAQARLDAAGRSGGINH